MSDRRKAKRIVITAVAEVNDPERNHIQEGYVANISDTGIGVFMKRPIEINSRVEIKMSFYTLQGIKDVERISGKVKRIEAFSSVYSIGIEFDGLDTRKDKELISYLTAAQKSI